MKNYVCIDIGGTSIKHGVLDRASMNFAVTGEMPTEAWKGGPGILEKIHAITRSYLSGYQPAGVCVSTAGMVDCAEGSIFYSAPLIPNYAGTQIKRSVEETFSLPCEVENDVNCAGLAENYYGASKNTHSSLCLTIGTGIGGCVIINNQVLHGYSGSGCEVGYMHMPGGEFQDLGAASILTKKVEQEKGEKGWDGRRVFAAARAGDECCIRAIDEMTDILGMGIANICYVVNPEIVVLGGGIMAQKDFLYDRIRRAMDRYLVPSVSSKTRLAFAENQNHAGMLGAFCHFSQIHGQE